MSERLKKTAIGILLGLALIAAFSLSPLPGGDDWEVFYHAGRRVLSGDPLYGEPIYHGFYYYNAPWLAVLIAPITILPSRLGRGMLSALTLILTILVVRRWDEGLLKPVLALLSPPMFYILLHGQVDAIVLAGVMLPSLYWGLVALSKPQVAIGLIFGVGDIRGFLKMIGVTAAVLLFSLLLFGNWPLELIRQPGPVGQHNIWLGLWPYQILVGMGIVFYGMNRKDERFFIAASPFFLPYAATSSLLGPWIVMMTLLKNWQATIVLLAWWAISVFRYFGGIPF